MFSSFSALRALLVAALCSPVLSLPSLPALSVKRSLQDYVDHLVYLDSSKSSLYSAVEAGQQTYGAYLDNHWGGLVMKSDKSSGSTSQITVESVSVTVSSNHGTIGFLQEDIEIDYYTTSQWPSSWPSIGGSSGVGAARIGIDITDSKSVMNQYLAGKYSKDLDNWYYDLFVFYDWMNATSQSVEIDFAGIITTGSTLDWTSVFDISANQVSQYGLPDLSSIKDQAYLYLRNDGTFYVDNCFWVNGQQVTVSSQVPKTSSSSVVVDIWLTQRWSMFPDAVVKALYGGLPGAKYYAQSTYGYYQFSCDAKFTFWFTIGGVKYAVNQEALMAPNPWGDQCIGSIFTKGQAVSAVPQYDIIFGFQFLSSFYYRAGVSHSSNQPYAKLLPLPEPSQGWSYGSSSGSWSWSSGSSGSGSGGIQYSDSWNNGGYKTSTAYGSSPTYNSASGSGGSGYSSGNSGSDWNGGSSGSQNSGYQGGNSGSQNSGYQGGNSGSWNGGNSGSSGSQNSGYQGGNSGNGGWNGGYQGGSQGSGYHSSQNWNGGNSGSGSGYQTSQNWNGGQHQQQSTSTVFTTTTIVHVGTTTVGWPASSTGGYGYGSGSGSGSGSGGYGGSGGSGYSSASNGYSGSGYSGSGSGSGSGYSGSGYQEDLAVAGNAAETDENGNDLNLPHGSIANQLKHCLPAIIIIAILVGLGAIGGLIACLVRRRRNRGSATPRPSAYSNLHDADTHGPVHVPLYGAEEGVSRYSDPYKDKE
ncbi:hypothetical protein OH77DRAFT_1518638 [Trametes cingulata]|nr:hypothetical protein OH77DRAFT_1518638 [Trametes cingulata]